MAKKKRKRTHNNCDYHHILFQRKHWQQGYAKLLREHRYLGKLIPQNTLHRVIHSKIHDVPTPNGADCKRAYNRLIEWENQGLIDVEKDTLEKRIEFLIGCWDDNCSATVAVLRWQQEVVHKFYNGR